ncbi:hypothetical protein HF086_018322 [Spodoptera exigua]|uniref:C2H2-type domain-containing protein n=1 Tax=Spodoptera exigua TaxID=7107 RepID=A0A922M0N2_SPOEX|nr:hypothetical protein HF086_018322 [Spodoptera exigua]
MASPTQPDAGWMEQAETVLGRKLTSIDLVGGIYCTICQSTFSNKKEYDIHYVDHEIGDADIGYTCVVCRKQFTGYPSFRNHCYLAHVAKNKHKCEHCPKSFSKQSILNNHIDTTHNFKCEPCQKLFPSKKELHTHQIIHGKDKPPYFCQECGKTIESIDMCEFHIDEHSTTLYTCPICNETNNNKVDAAKHLTHHFGEVLTDDDITASDIGDHCSIDILGGVLCNYCDELFKNRVEFDTHFTTEHGDKPLVYSCNICGKQCTECGKTFPRLSLLVTHTEAYHSEGSGEKPFLCGECGHGFKSPRRLSQHARAVHATCALRCTQPACPLTFESLKELLLHQRSHRARRGPWCRQCGLQFTTLWSCERHLDVHRKKSYACPVCGRTYREKYLILKHIPSHFESVLHVCKVCGKVFSLRSRLVQHSKTHSDLRAYKCSVCNKGFMKASVLEQHLNIHTGFRPYKCTVCPKTFASHPNWYKHLRRVHNVDKEDIKNSKDNQNKTITATEPSPATVNDTTDAKMKIESGIDSTSSEMSIETNCFMESDDSTMDSLDPTIIEKDWCVSNENFKIENLQENVQYTDMLPINNTTFDFDVSQLDSLVAEYSAVAAAPTGAAEPREYGPDCGAGAGLPALDGVLDLDDHLLPHIDPLLTIKTPATPSAWEPLITKVYHGFDDADLNRLSIMNTDIF